MHSSNKSLEANGGVASNPKVSILRSLGFLVVCVLPFALAWNSTRLLAGLIGSNDTFSQIPLIPLVSLFLIYERRKAIFAEISSEKILGLALLIPGITLVVVAGLNLWDLEGTNPVSLFVFALILVWLAAFVLFFGRRAFRVASFPLLFLLFMVPIPEPLLTKIIYLLQAGSSGMAELFFNIVGVPYHRMGFVFDLPGVSIRVAEECSGIRSTLALLITTVLASYIFLSRPWKRLLLCLAVVPIAMFKNGLRIATLSTLSVYVNPAFLYGNLHHRGGVVFFMIALVPMALLLRMLQKSEGHAPGALGNV
jgi:exosortase